MVTAVRLSAPMSLSSRFVVVASLALVAAACETQKSDTADGVTLVGDQKGTGGGAGSGEGTGDTGTVEAPAFGFTTVSGFVFDQNRQPLADALVTTRPPTESVRTNGQGLYFINAGRAYGVLTVEASKNDYAQRTATCANLKAGVNNLGDVQMVRTSGGGFGQTCDPACAANQKCVNSFCVSKCEQPACACNELCGADGKCAVDPNAPAAGVCGGNSHPLGGGVCECDTGFVPAGDGSSCVVPSALKQCPDGAKLNKDNLCICNEGLIPDATGSRCLPPDQAAIVTAVGDGKVLREWATPGPAPRALAFDGVGLWIGDAATGKLVRTSLTKHEVDQELALGPIASSLIDMTSIAGVLYLQFGAHSSTAGKPTLQRIDPKVGKLEVIDANSFTTPGGLTNDGVYLISLEGLQIKQRLASTGANTGPKDVLFDPTKTGQSFAVTPPTALRLLTTTQNQYIGWVGTDFDGINFRATFSLLNAVHKTKSPEIGRIELLLGASHVVGIDAFGSTLWLAVAGTGNPAVPVEKGGINPPKIVEVSLD